MSKLIVGTAGHVDHGKTRLVEALTGIDCDRWEEEKRRGITLDLGYAHLTDGDVQIGFVDVPGHQRFLHNALAGLGGIRALLLVVDAGEGVRPQTIEHLEIAGLLAIEHLVVAITKIDAVEPDWVELVRDEVRGLLQRHGYSTAPILTVSALSGEGVQELATTLRQLAIDLGHRPPRPLRIPVDRAFQVRGQGTIVTGSLVEGMVSVSEELAIDEGQRTVRVRKIEVHGQERDQASSGERIALQVAGAAPQEVQRGTQLTRSGSYSASRSFAARLTLLPSAAPLESSQDLRMHLFAAELAARLRPLDGPITPGASGWVEGVLARRVPIAVGDRAIVRRPSPKATLGGLLVVDPLWHRPRGKRLATAMRCLAASSDTIDTTQQILLWAEAGRLGGISAGDAARALGVSKEEAARVIQRIAQDGRLLQIPSPNSTSPDSTSPDSIPIDATWISPAVFQDLSEQTNSLLKQFHRRNPMEPGLSKAEFVRRLLARAPDAQSYLQLLADSRAISVDAEHVNLPGRAPALDSGQERLAEKLEKRLSDLAFAVPSPRQLAEQLQANPKVVEGLLHHLRRQGRAVKLSSGLWVGTSTLDRVTEDLRQSGWSTFTVGEFKQRYDLTRKWAIPVLEYLDKMRVTARQGNNRVILPAKPR